MLLPLGLLAFSACEINVNSNGNDDGTTTACQDCDGWIDVWNPQTETKKVNANVVDFSTLVEPDGTLRYFAQVAVHYECSRIENIQFQIERATLSPELRATGTVTVPVGDNIACAAIYAMPQWMEVQPSLFKENDSEILIDQSKYRHRLNLKQMKAIQIAMPTESSCKKLSYAQKINSSLNIEAIEYELPYEGIKKINVVDSAVDVLDHLPTLENFSRSVSYLPKVPSGAYQVEQIILGAEKDLLKLLPSMLGEEWILDGSVYPVCLD